MNKYLVGIIALVIGIVGFVFPIAKDSPPKGGSLGGTVENFPVKFTNGLRAGTTDQLSVSSTGGISTTGNITSATYNSGSIGSSTSTLGSAIAGHFLIPPAGATGNASTTAITANSSVFLQQELTSPIAATCNTVVASTTVVNTRISGNGFTVLNSYAPATNSQCMAYWIIN